MSKDTVYATISETPGDPPDQCVRLIMCFVAANSCGDIRSGQRFDFVEEFLGTNGPDAERHYLDSTFLMGQSTTPAILSDSITNLLNNTYWGKFMEGQILLDTSVYNFLAKRLKKATIKQSGQKIWAKPSSRGNANDSKKWIDWRDDVRQNGGLLHMFEALHYGHIFACRPEPKVEVDLTPSTQDIFMKEIASFWTNVKSNFQTSYYHRKQRQPSIGDLTLLMNAFTDNCPTMTSLFTALRESRLEPTELQHRSVTNAEKYSAIRELCGIILITQNPKDLKVFQYIFSFLLYCYNVPATVFDLLAGFGLTITRSAFDKWGDALVENCGELIRKAMDSDDLIPHVWIDNIDFERQSSLGTSSFHGAMRIITFMTHHEARPKIRAYSAPTEEDEAKVVDESLSTRLAVMLKSKYPATFTTPIASTVNTPHESRENLEFRSFPVLDELTTSEDGNIATLAQTFLDLKIELNVDLSSKQKSFLDAEILAEIRNAVQTGDVQKMTKILKESQSDGCWVISSILLENIRGLIQRLKEMPDFLNNPNRMKVFEDLRQFELQLDIFMEDLGNNQDSAPPSLFICCDQLIFERLRTIMKKYCELQNLIMLTIGDLHVNWGVMRAITSKFWKTILEPRKTFIEKNIDKELIGATGPFRKVDKDASKYFLMARFLTDTAYSIFESIVEQFFDITAYESGSSLDVAKVLLEKCEEVSKYCNMAMNTLDFLKATQVFLTYARAVRHNDGEMLLRALRMSLVIFHANKNPKLRKQVLDHLQDLDGLPEDLFWTVLRCRSVTANGRGYPYIAMDNLGEWTIKLLKEKIRSNPTMKSLQRHGLLASYAVQFRLQSHNILHTHNTVGHSSKHSNSQSVRHVTTKINYFQQQKTWIAETQVVKKAKISMFEEYAPKLREWMTKNRENEQGENEPLPQNIETDEAEDLDEEMNDFLLFEDAMESTL